MVDAPRHRPLWVQLLVFGAALIISLLIAGKEVRGPSANPHYAHMAQSWTQGSLSLKGTPPGFCSRELRRAKKCKRHSYDDWARVFTVHLKDGTALRGMPCKSERCAANRKPGVMPFMDMHGEVHQVPAAQVERSEERWFVSFPPGPAVAMLPFVAVGGLGVWDVLLTCLFAALAPLVILRGLDRVRGEAASSHLWICAAWALASPALFVGAHGSVWFTAQTLGALFTLAYVFEAYAFSGAADARPFRAGLWLALAMSCRPHAAFGVFLFVVMWKRAGANSRAALKFLAPLVVVGLGLALHNYLRFESPFEFGHRFLDIRWQRRMQSEGQFSLIYLARNLECLFWLLPQARAQAPGFAVSLHGSALWVMSPWLFALAGAHEQWRSHLREHGPALGCALLVAAPALLYHNSGQRQLSYRFALDWLPYLLPLLAASPWVRGRLFRAAVLVGALLSCSSAWYFDRAPANVFVTDPLGWPFEAELK